MARNKGRSDHDDEDDRPLRRAESPIRTPPSDPSSARQSKSPRRASTENLPAWWIRYPISLWILWHIVALCIGPLEVSVMSVEPRAMIPGGPITPPDFDPRSAPSLNTTDGAPPAPARGAAVYPEPVVFRATRFFAPYLDALYLHHGYHFFAPDPGPAHIFDFEVERAEGEPIKGRFPDLADQWPRLYYHRHFMLAEQVADISPAPLDSSDPLGAARAYARHLLKAHDGTRVTLRRSEHKLLTPNQILDGVAPDADWTYVMDGPGLGELTETKQAAETKPQSNLGAQGANAPEQIAIPNHR